jgi:hypothetical protein
VGTAAESTVMRLFKILFGYLAACLSGGATVLLASLAGIGGWPFEPGILTIGMALAGIVTLIYAFPAAFALIVIAEIGKVETWLFYVLGGGVAAMVSFIWLGLEPVADLTANGLPFAAAIIAGGMVAGLVYWAIAGYRA